MRRVAVALILIAAFPSFAFAQDVTALLAQIQALQAQIAALQKASGIFASPATCDLPTKTMKKGDSGEHISKLQEFLARDLIVYPEAVISGYYGGLTERAVQRWQFKKGIVTSGTPETTGYGKVGPKTLTAMRAEWCLQSLIAPSPFTPAPGAVVPGSTKPATTTATQTQAQTLPRIMFTAPAASTTVYQGGSLFISWKSENTPLASQVVLNLKRRDGQMLGTVKNELPSTGSYSWYIPKPPPPPTSTCSGDPITCISEIAQTPSTCQSFCSLAAGLYTLIAQVVSGSREIATAESRVFSIGGAALTNYDLSYTGTTWDYSTALYTNNVSNSTSTFNQQAGAPAAGQSCTYSGVLYNDGISVEINCADVTVYGQSCQPYGGMQLTCRNGKWVDKNGVAQTVRNVTTTPGAGSCITPWMAQIVANGNSVPKEPFFSNGAYTITGPMPIMKCSGGSWLQCDFAGDNCR